MGNLAQTHHGPQQVVNGAFAEKIYNVTRAPLPDAIDSIFSLKQQGRRPKHLGAVAADQVGIDK